MRSRDPWWSRFGPIVLSKARRRYWAFVTTAWLALGLVLAIAGRFGLLWFPVLGLIGSLSVLVRDRVGRRSMFDRREGPGDPPAGDNGED